MKIPLELIFLIGDSLDDPRTFFEFLLSFRSYGLEVCRNPKKYIDKFSYLKSFAVKQTLERYRFYLNDDFLKVKDNKIENFIIWKNPKPNLKFF